MCRLGLCHGAVGTRMYDKGEEDDEEARRRDVTEARYPSIVTITVTDVVTNITSTLVLDHVSRKLCTSVSVAADVRPAWTPAINSLHSILHACQRSSRTKATPSFQDTCAWHRKRDVDPNV